jgi:hypothetical protein
MSFVKKKNYHQKKTIQQLENQTQQLQTQLTQLQFSKKEKVNSIFLYAQF